ncbi:MAG TPA: SPASM domain-containing protein, partial [Polyangiaceae bacterium]|nr:SPASM domain-containing protein [Polyangiaceae bacterium]
ALDRGLLITVGNNIGYFGPHEHELRGRGDETVHWSGCAAGQNVLGIEADGTVKGCPSLRTLGYAGGNVRDVSLEEIWRSAPEMHFGRVRSVRDLWGFCGTCYYADVCRAGCTWTADSLFGRPGNNPYCHYRVLELAKRGLRERIVKEREAAQSPFAIGKFALVVEPLSGSQDAALPASVPKTSDAPLVQLRKRQPSAAQGRPEQMQVGRVPPILELCRACNQYVVPPATHCPHCGVELAAARADHAEVVERRTRLLLRLQRAMDF